MKYLNLKKHIATVLFFTLLMYPIYKVQSQDSNLGNWLIYIGNKKLKNNWNLHHEVQLRSYNTIGDLEQLLLRTGLGYSFNETKSNILLGYGYITSENYFGTTDQKFTVNEHRIFQQLTTKQRIGIVSVNHRYRFEQRFVEEEFKMRFRYFLAINIPFNKEKDNIYFSAYNEIFLNTKTSIFDRNRIYAGIGYKINKNIRLEAGYMNQFFETTSRDQLNIISFVNF